MIFQCKAISGKEEKKKNIPFVENNVVKVNFLDFQANIFPLLFKLKGGKFPFKGFRTRRF
jgi:hypothetical protein